MAKTKLALSRRAKGPHRRAGSLASPTHNSYLEISRQKIKKAIDILDEAPVPKNRLFWLDPLTPTFQRLKRAGRIRKVEHGIWEVVK